MTLDVAVEAIRLVEAGGSFFPADRILAARGRPTPAQAKITTSQQKSLFTDRQAAIVDAIRRGKANKVIAYELNMRESTVKVHVRNIMKKLNAKNRTEVAFLTTQHANARSS
jgi:DNA-binding NarL/FixJ family response regulator